MKQSFEERLIIASSEATVKSAKQLLKNLKLVCAWRDENGAMSGAFAGGEKIEYAKVSTGENNKAKCSCNDAARGLCPHAVALIMHFGSTNSKFVESGKESDDPVSFGALKFESFAELAEKNAEAPQAAVHVSVDSAFPHVPSKWENAVLSVKLKFANKEYIGNVNNLRQLYFSKSLSALLKLNYFSLQDRQIIRFLAVNAEPDNSRLLLNSEQTAEFFHCMINYERFTKDGKRIIVHGETAAAAVLFKRSVKKIQLIPSIVLDEALLPLQATKVITGRSGVWIGINGEYWWVPATVDVGWLRNFFGTGAQIFDIHDSVAAINAASQMPVKLIRDQASMPDHKPCTICLDGGFQADRSFRLELKFCYDGRIFTEDQGRLASSDGHFWRRDDRMEKSVVQELLNFGFKRHCGAFKLDNIEAAGIFLDILIPVWRRQNRDLLLGGTIGALCCGGTGVPQVIFNCRCLPAQAEAYPVEYTIAGNELKIHWHSIAKTIKNNCRYLYPAPNTIVRLNSRILKFFKAASNIVENISDNDFRFDIPYCSIHYWRQIGKDIPGAVPPEFYLDQGSNVLSSRFDTNDAVFTDPEIFQGTLRGYQQEGVRWMRMLLDNNFNIILADEMGLGKTIQALALLASRKDVMTSPALVVCPASLVENWRREAARFVPSFRTVALSGTDRQRYWDSIENYDLMILSYAVARRDAPIMKDLHFSYLILDEAQHIKNHATVNARSCKEIRAKQRLVLTGTPLENSIEDLWSIFDFLNPKLLGQFNAFRKYYANIQLSKELRDDLTARIAPFIKRRTKALVCEELPPKHERTLFCEMEDEQRALYDKYFSIGREKLKNIRPGDERSSMEILTILLRLRQICCDPELLPDHQQEQSAKLELLKELVLQNIDSGHKMLLFSQFTSLLAIIRRWLDEEKILYEYLDGSTQNRQQCVDNFNNSPEIPLFLLSLKAGGTGLNLTSADTVIIYDPWWNPAVEAQAADRTHRIGQTRPVECMKLVVKDSIEEKILEMQARKQAVFDDLIEDAKSFNSKLTLEDYRMLFN
ncbi:MAG: DEAD/DEAH box helicase [Victivallaceae bacterium]